MQQSGPSQNRLPGGASVQEMRQTIQSLRALNDQLQAELQREREQGRRLQAKIGKREAELESQQLQLSRSQTVEQSVQLSNRVYRQSAEEAAYQLRVVEKQLDDQRAACEMLRAEYELRLDAQQRESEETARQLRFVIAQQDDKIRQLQEECEQAAADQQRAQAKCERTRLDALLAGADAGGLGPWKSLETGPREDLLDELIERKRRLFLELRADLGQ